MSIEKRKSIFNLRDKGFTIIELLVVISIVGVLGSTIYAPFNEARKKGRDAKRVSEIKAIQNSLLAYSDNYGSCYPIFSAGTGLPTLSIKYLSAGLYNKITWIAQTNNSPENNGILGTAWAAIKPYFYKAFGNRFDCIDSAFAAPSYHLYVELENKNPALETDADSDASAVLGDYYSPRSGYILRGIDLSASSLERCTDDSGGNWDCVYDVSN